MIKSFLLGSILALILNIAYPLCQGECLEFECQLPLYGGECYETGETVWVPCGSMTCEYGTWYMYCEA